MTIARASAWHPVGLASRIAGLAHTLKTPHDRARVRRPAERDRTDAWSYENYLAAVLESQVGDREDAGSTMRIRTARLTPAITILERIDAEHLPGLRRDLLVHHTTATFMAKVENVMLLGPPRIGKTHFATALGVKAAHAGTSAPFDAAVNWTARLAATHQSGSREAELKPIRRYRLIVVDEVGYVFFDTDAVNLVVQLIASRYGQASVLVTANLPFGRRGEVLGDEVVVASMVDHLVHHAEVPAPGRPVSYRARRELSVEHRDNRRHTHTEGQVRPDERGPVQARR